MWKLQEQKSPLGSIKKNQPPYEQWSFISAPTRGRAERCDLNGSLLNLSLLGGFSGCNSQLSILSPLQAQPQPQSLLVVMVYLMSRGGKGGVGRVGVGDREVVEVFCGQWVTWDMPSISAVVCQDICLSAASSKEMEFHPFFATDYGKGKDFFFFLNEHCFGYE